MLIPLVSICSGVVIGLLLGVFGGGGSIMAVPLMLYAVGITDPHIAIGTSAVAVTVSALGNLAIHTRAGNVKWPCATAFAVSGAIGAFVGAKIGQLVNGTHLIIGFAVAMVGVGVSMLRRPTDAGDPNVHINPPIAKRLIPTGLAAGLASGFFGIGGGFLIVPGLVSAANMTFIHAVGSSLVAVAAFAASTAASYAIADLVRWDIAGFFIVGGFLGGLIGRAASPYLGQRKALVQRAFSLLIFVTAAYLVVRAT